MRFVENTNRSRNLSCTSRVTKTNRFAEHFNVECRVVELILEPKLFTDPPPPTSKKRGGKFSRCSLAFGNEHLKELNGVKTCPTSVPFEFVKLGCVMLVCSPIRGDKSKGEKGARGWHLVFLAGSFSPQLALFSYQDPL